MVITAAYIAMGAALACALAEWLHARRCRRVANLVFGPTGRPRTWVRGVSAARCASAALLTWGMLVLMFIEPIPKEIDPETEPARHLMLVLDVSPSMYIEDAGPGRKQSRSQRAADLLQAIMHRLDMTQTRVTVVAFYTEARPVVVEGFDLNVVDNILNGLPLEHAFEPGQTKLQEGVEASFEYARPWAPGSAAIVVVSDGDTISKGAIAEKPVSIADALVIGVGDPFKGSPVAGRTSRQDEASLKRLAVRLGGVYHNGNTKHLPSEIVRALSMTVPLIHDERSMRDYALLAVGLGGVVLGILSPILAFFGHPRRPRAYPAAAGFSDVSGKNGNGRPHFVYDPSKPGPQWGRSKPQGVQA